MGLKTSKAFDGGAQAWWRYLAALTLLCALAGGCRGGSGNPPVPSSKPAAKAAPRLDAVVDPAVANANRTMAAGVPLGESAAPVELRFDLRSVPAPGAPFTVALAVLPATSVPVLRLEVDGGEWLSAAGPDGAVSREKIAAGTAVPLEIRMVSSGPGTRILTVRVTMELPDGPQTRTFAFPVVVLAPAAALQAGPPKPTR